MKAKFKSYLKQLGATKPIEEKVEYFCRLCGNIIPGQSLLDIFLDDYLAEDGSRKYSGLTFFSKDYTFAIPNFLTSDQIAVGRHGSFQDVIAIAVEGFDFTEANDKSLMSIELFYRGSSSNAGHYRASKKNCEHLLGIFRKYIQQDL